jgi:hypothetical protein
MTQAHPPRTRKSIRLFLTGVASVLIAIALCGVTYSVFYAGTQQVVSAVATGTAPFAVASTTLVANLNGDLLNGQNDSYYNDSPSTWACTTRNQSCSCEPPCSCEVNVSCQSNENPINYGTSFPYALAATYVYTPVNRSTINCYTSRSSGLSATVTCFLLCCK